MYIRVPSSLCLLALLLLWSSWSRGEETSHGVPPEAPVAAREAVEIKFPLGNVHGIPYQVTFNAASMVIERLAPEAPADSSMTPRVLTIEDARFSTCARSIGHRHYDMTAKTFTVYYPEMRYEARQVRVFLGGVHLLTLPRLNGSLAKGHARMPLPSLDMGKNSQDGAYVGAKFQMPVGEQKLKFTSRLGTERPFSSALSLNRSFALGPIEDGEITILAGYHEEVANHLSSAEGITVSRLPALHLSTGRIALPVLGGGNSVHFGAGIGRYHEEPSEVSASRMQVWGIFDTSRFKLAGMEIYGGMGMQLARNGSQSHAMSVGMLSLGTPEEADTYLNTAYVHRAEQGSTPFLFDHPDIRNELLSEADFSLGKASNWRMNVINRYDLDKGSTRDLAVTAIFQDDCFSYGLTYNTVKHSFDFGIAINGLDTFRSGGAHLGFPL